VRGSFATYATSVDDDDDDVVDDINDVDVCGSFGALKRIKFYSKLFEETK
jgi:hypothetical protein